MIQEYIHKKSYFRACLTKYIHVLGRIIRLELYPCCAQAIWARQTNLIPIPIYAFHCLGAACSYTELSLDKPILLELKIDLSYILQSRIPTACGIYGTRLELPPCASTTLRRFLAYFLRAATKPTPPLQGSAQLLYSAIGLSGTKPVIRYRYILS